MTKKHFIAIAEMFKTQVETVSSTEYLSEAEAAASLCTIKCSVAGFISLAAQDNPRFDARRFRTACGVFA